MITVARGTKQIRKLEPALGEKPPQKAAIQCQAALKQYVEGRLKQRRAHQAAFRPLLEKAQAPLRDLLTPDKTLLRKLVKQQQAAFRVTRKKPVLRHPLLPDVPQPGIEQGFLLKFPPYDEAFQYASNPYPAAQAQADKAVGTYKFDVEGDGDSNAASAGIGVYFFAYEDNPIQRVAALVDYDYIWGTWSINGYTAHNDGATNIWVWGVSENRWVAQTGSLSPYWSDGTGWFDQHGSGGYPPTEQFGRQSTETFFPAAANNFYLVWIWSEGSCDDSASILGASYAAQQQRMSVPMITFGSL
ncbi:MAG TPA: hypothetical protein VHW69_10830 [Rhizomicrobium sp.]|nr:hypothetical protein [Rhizomicrobium sp.]